MKPERERQIPNDIAYMWNLKYGTNETIYKIETDSQREKTYGCQGRGRNRMDWEFGVSRYKLLHLEWISNEVLLYSTGNYIQSLGIDQDGRLYEKKNVHICMTGSPCCTAEIDTTL